MHTINDIYTVVELLKKHPNLPVNRLGTLGNLSMYKIRKILNTFNKVCFRCTVSLHLHKIGLELINVFLYYRSPHQITKIIEFAQNHPFIKQITHMLGYEKVYHLQFRIPFDYFPNLLKLLSQMKRANIISNFSIFQDQKDHRKIIRNQLEISIDTLDLLIINELLSNFRESQSQMRKNIETHHQIHCTPSTFSRRIARIKKNLIADYIVEYTGSIYNQQIKGLLISTSIPKNTFFFSKVNHFFYKYWLHFQIFAREFQTFLEILREYPEGKLYLEISKKSFPFKKAMFNESTTQWHSDIDLLNMQHLINV